MFTYYLLFGYDNHEYSPFSEFAVSITNNRLSNQVLKLPEEQLNRFPAESIKEYPNNYHRFFLGCQ